jgi:hypothetical protein
MLHILVILWSVDKQAYIHGFSYSWVKICGMNNCTRRAVLRHAWPMRQSNCGADEQGTEKSWAHGEVVEK